jgi:hypothetical protein
MMVTLDCALKPALRKAKQRMGLARQQLQAT